MPTLQELERPIDEAMADQLIQATPEWWKAAVLEIKQSTLAKNAQSFEYEIRSPEGHPEFVHPTEEIFELGSRLSDLFAKAGHPWSRVVYTVHQTSALDWQYRVEFTY
jgi:hypothetical protein